MGNEHSKKHHHHKQPSSPPSDQKSDDKISERSKKCFDALAQGNETITLDSLKALFSQNVAESLWTYLSEGKSELSLGEVHAKFTPLLGTSTDIYVKIYEPVHHFIKVCLEAAGGEAYESDIKFINNLTDKMLPDNGTWNDIAEWKRRECPRFCNPLQNHVMNKLLNVPAPPVSLGSDILSPLQMMYLKGSLPISFFPTDPDTNDIVSWSLLYTSAMQGISVNRFETNVFDYKGHTVTIISLKDGRVVVIATETMLRNSTTPYGGPETFLYELEPNITKIQSANAIYSNFKIRSASMGLSFKEYVKIGKDLDEIKAIEVWGCASGKSLKEQRSLREWQAKQAERHKKVPLPGNWDDNPDKTLLEMAGFQFSNERANMEKEAKQKEDEKKNDS